MSNVDASVAQQVARGCRLGMRLEIAGRPDDGRPEILGHADYDHVPCELYSLTLVDYSRYCRAVPPVTIAPWTSNAPVRSPRARAQPTGSPGPCVSIRCFKPPIRRARPAPASRSSRALARRGIRIPWGRL